LATQRSNERFSIDRATLAKIPEWVKIAKLIHRREVPIENGTFSCYRLYVSGKLKSLAELKAIRAEAKRQAQSVVFTNGCFDLLHRGHVYVLREARACGYFLIVAINSDRSVKTIKGPRRPVLPENDRVELIAAMEMVDYVVLFDEPDPYHLIAALNPDVLVKGGDWSAEKIIGADVVERNGGRVAVVPYLKGFSTSEIIERMKN
jgi:D-beta-D-heptose 7-phosphate kinase/D-beta-D-heptose 1-phosphate adenosyltransferase